MFILGFLLIFIPLVDYVWLAKIASGFYLSELGPLARTQQGVFSPIIWPALVVYVCLALGTYFFVLPKSEDWLQALGWGALFGFCVYGVYEMTNYSLVANWPIKIVWADLAWGTFLCGLASVAAKLLMTWKNW